MAKVLLQTTISYAEDDWHIGRFSLLAQALRGGGHDVTCRDRDPGIDGDDRVISGLAESGFDELWLFGADAGNGLSLRDVRGINAFRAQGGGLLTARDHEDVGHSLSELGDIGKANYFHSSSPEPDLARRVPDDRETPSISWPNYHSGANGDYQRVVVIEPKHLVLSKALSGSIEYFPAHPHEGAIGVEQCGGRGRVIAMGASEETSRPFNLVVAFEPRTAGDGKALVHSSFHHFADCNWDPNESKPSFVTEQSGNGMLKNLQAAGDIREYCLNAAKWLARE